MTAPVAPEGIYTNLDVGPVSWEGPGAPPPGALAILSAPGFRVVDRQAVALLRNWARHPWIPAIRCELADRFEELGLSLLAKTTRGLCSALAEHPAGIPFAWEATGADRLPRRARQRVLRLWRQVLVMSYGDFESNSDTLPCEEPADTTGPPF